MKICVAQTRPVTGDIQSNIDRHKELIQRAISHQTDLIIFPELSLTGYEPELAEALAIDQNDPKLEDFQKLSDSSSITIGVGIPTRDEAGICISMILFQPQLPRRIYSKQHIHQDEEPFFVSGQGFPVLHTHNTAIAPAICYEISVPEHTEKAFKNGAQIYLASVAKFVNGIDKALDRLSSIARQYSMTILMSNCIGTADGLECAGQSAVWNDQGLLIGQLNDSQEGLLIFDAETKEIVKEYSKNKAVF